MNSKKTAVTVTAVFVLLLSATGGVLAQSPSNSVAAGFGSSTTNSNTVVVAIGNQTTTNGRAALTEANAIAAKNNETVVNVGNSNLPISVVSTLTQRLQHGNLKNAVVVGVNQTKTDAVSAAVHSIGYKSADGVKHQLKVVNEITGGTPKKTLRIGALQAWSSSSSMYVTASNKRDYRRTALANSMSSVKGRPVMSASDSYNNINSTANLLGVNTIYVSQHVGSTLKSKLSNQYTVKTKVNGVSMSQSTMAESVGLTPNSTKYVGVVDQPDQVFDVGQLGSGAHTGVLVTSSSSVLGNQQAGKLKNLTSPNAVYILGRKSDIGNTVLSKASSLVPTGTTTTRIGYTKGHPREMDLRESLLTSGYTYGVVSPYVTQKPSNITVQASNIGFSSIHVVGNSSVTMTWKVSGGTPSSTPQGHMAGNGQYAVSSKSSLPPGHSYNVTVTGATFQNGGYPELSYYVGSSGSFLGSTGGIGFFGVHVSSLPSWIGNTVNSLVHINPLNLSTNQIVEVVVALIISIGGLWAVWKVLGNAIQTEANRK